MPKSFPIPDRLFDRTWRPGHPFRPRVSGLRRWTMGIIFCLLCVLIGGYWYITDANRVRKMAEAYLSTLLGAPVTVQDASLSIFEGLRLDDVRIYADTQGKPDSLLFSAHSFLVEYDARALFSGRLEAKRIVAVEPRVHVIEDADTGLRNYGRLIEGRSASSVSSAAVSGPINLPEIILRNAQVQYQRVRDGKVLEGSSIAIEGQLMPVPVSKIYRFTFQSRGRQAGIGPMVTGQMVMGTGRISASLQNFDFGVDVKTMLPPDVRDWWQNHDLSGRVNVPLLSIDPPSQPGGHLGYQVEIELQGVKLSVRPQEWMSAEEDRQLSGIHRGMDAMRIAGLNANGFVDEVAQLIEPMPVTLRDVRGRFIFSDDQKIKIEDLNVRMEEIPFKISGTIDGYNPSAPAHIRIASSELSDTEIPPAPRYLNSMPQAVRELYERFKPSGTCRFWIDLIRSEPGGHPRATGEVNIVDGRFTFEKFAYPVRKVSGKFILTRNAKTGEDEIIVDHVRGYGMEGGPNSTTLVDMTGDISPLGPESHVDMLITGANVSSEPALMSAFPPVTQKALTLFDAPGKGEFPKFNGEFACHVVRLRGLESKWIIETTLRLDRAAGALVAFPYPMDNVTGQLKIFDDHIDLKQITMNRNDASLQIDGRVYWPSGDSRERSHTGDEPPPLRPDLKIIARNVPVDRDLIAAMPPQQRLWLEKVGAAGRFDLDGTIKPATTGGQDVDFKIGLRDASLWPIDEKYTLSHLEGSLRLTNQRLMIDDLRGRRGDAPVTARGEVSWGGDQPKAVLDADAKDLALDQPLYGLLPEPAQTAWQQIKPEGTVDVTLHYSGALAAATQPTTKPASRSGGGYEVRIIPKKLSATPVAVPYRLDELQGSVTLTPGYVVLSDLTARHGDAKLRFAGTGSLGDHQIWNLTLGGDKVVVDDEFRKAVPDALADLLKSIEMKGTVAFDFSKLRMDYPPTPDSGKASTRAAAAAAPDIDFAVKLQTDGASVDVGMPLADVKGALEFAGSSRTGKLANLSGKLDFDSLTLAGRTVTNLHSDMLKAADQDYLSFQNMEAKLAGGSMVGRVDYHFPDNRPSQYAVNLVLRNADVKQLAGDTDQNIQGAMSASLAIEGTYDQPASRRGRGDVSVSGQQMYKIPLVLGLLQITNLSLPISSPFTDASARYTIDGSKVNFEQIELRSKGMLMQGDGNLDFSTKQVRMKFFTDSTAWPKLPLIADLIDTAKHELLQIQVRGTLKEPQVSARSMNTFTTTVDEVLKGDDKSPPPRK